MGHHRRLSAGELAELDALFAAPNCALKRVLADREVVSRAIGFEHDASWLTCPRKAAAARDEL